MQYSSIDPPTPLQNNRKKIIEELGIQNTIIHNMLYAQNAYNWTWEQTLENMVIILTDRVDELEGWKLEVIRKSPFVINQNIERKIDIDNE